MVQRLLVVVFLALLGYCGYTSWSERHQLAEQAEEREREELAFQQAVLDMAARNDAVTDWESRLAGGERVRRIPVMTAELQKLWLTEQPILFVGNLSDISVNGEGQYEIVAELGLATPNLFLSNQIEVNFTCPASVTTPLLEARREPSASSGWGADVAITGLVRHIERTAENQADGVTTLTGFGTCLDAMPLPGVSFRNVP